jgi:hypothetical protein
VAEASAQAAAPVAESPDHRWGIPLYAGQRRPTHLWGMKAHSNRQWFYTRGWSTTKLSEELLHLSKCFPKSSSSSGPVAPEPKAGRQLGRRLAQRPLPQSADDVVDGQHRLPVLPGRAAEPQPKRIYVSPTTSEQAKMVGIETGSLTVPQTGSCLGVGWDRAAAVVKAIKAWE